MTRRMRAGSVVSEAWRNLVSGTTRAGVFAVVFILGIGLIGVVDLRSMVTILAGADQFRAAGASVQVLKGPGMVDGQRCDALSGTGAVNRAGALRKAASVTILNLPASPVTVIDATPNLVAMLPMIAQPVQTGADVPGGVWLSADLAQVLGAAPGTVIHTAAGDAVVAGVYTWRDDGRARDLGYALVNPVPADGVFDQCWAEIWPADGNLAGLSYMSLTRDPAQAQVTLGQLNTTLGTTYDAASLLAHRLTAHAPWVAAVIGLVLGWVAVRLRRLEVASALHARVPKADLMWSHLLEAVAWAGAASVITAAGLVWAARIGNPDPGWAVWLDGVRIIVVGAAATLLGTIAGVATTREKHLFRYSKDR